MKKKIIIAVLVIATSFLLTAMMMPLKREFKIVKTFNIPEARQGIAVDEDYFYAIDTRAIAKYEKGTGKLTASWQGEEEGQIKHLDSGIIIDGKLYCAHSNYPEFPMTSSMEVWDPETLEHIESYSFGIEWGSCTWVDKHDGYWWAVFAHYNKWSDSTGTDVRNTTLVKFDEDWRKLEAWVFPAEVLKKFGNMSNSGGSWGPDGYLYITGHDNPELYVMKVPEIGSELELIETVSINCTGQGFAWDRTRPGYIYTINRPETLVICSEMKKENE